MTTRRHAQLSLAVVLWGVAIKSLDELLDPELRRIDKLLDDPALLDEVYRAQAHRRPHSATRGRRGTPAEVVLRMLVLRHLRSWTFARLEWEVTGSIAYRHFCRVDANKVPDEKTMIRQEALLGPDALARVFQRVTAVAVEEKVTTGRKLRIDTTVVEAPVHYPTDSSLLTDVVRVVRRGLVRLVAAGARLPFALRRVGRAVTRRARAIGEALRLRGDRAREALKKPYRGLLRITGRLVRQAVTAVRSAAQQLATLPSTARRGVERTLCQLRRIIPLGREVIRQTRLRLFRGVTDSATKIISVFQPWAQILRRGKLHKPTEFGALVKVQEADGGIITDIGVVAGKADAPLLVPAVEKHIEVFGRPPRLVATDRGFFSTEGEQRLVGLGVKRAVVPKPGYHSAERQVLENQRWFRRGRAWRAGGEACISRLKRRFGMARSRTRGPNGAQLTALWAGIALNLAVIAAQRP